jgi:hypothetical protein
MSNVTKDVLPPEDKLDAKISQEDQAKLDEISRNEVAHDKLNESSISTEAIDFEESSFVEKNKHAGTQQKSDKDVNDDDVDDYENEFIRAEAEKVIEEENMSDEERMDKVVREIADQPFEVAMGNLEVERDELVRAAAGIFSPKGYFEQDFQLPFGGSVTMRSKTVNDYVDYTEYVRRLLLDPISQKEFDTFTQLRNLSYAIVVLDGDDLSSMDIEDRFELLKNTSEIKVTAIINLTKSFWRIAHLLLHPGLVDFLASSPEE